MRIFPEAVDVAIVGSGPAGLGAALSLHDRGVGPIAVFERDHRPGGVLRQCIHSGFGLEVFSEDLTGPQFAGRLLREIEQRNIRIFNNSMVLEAGGGRILVSGRTGGLKSISVQSVILASGCRERTRENLEIPGTRPSGVFTAGQAQAMINLQNLNIGSRAVIQGSGDIGLIMARRLSIEGCRVEGVYERLPYLSGLIRNKVQCLDHFGIPLHLSRQITRIIGRDRVQEVETSLFDAEGRILPESLERIECDTVLFSVGLIPELELGEAAGVGLFNRIYPVTGADFQAVPGIFICGNSLHINDLADSAYLEGRRCGDAVFSSMKKGFVPDDRNPGLPYHENEKEKGFDGAFFSKLNTDGKKICIVCPKGCLLSGNDYGCPRGESYFNLKPGQEGQKLTTTVLVPSSEGRIRGCYNQRPAISLTEVSMSRIPELVDTLRKSCLNLTPGEETGRVFRISAGDVVFEIGE